VLALEHCCHAHHWTAEEQSIVQAVADQVGIALGQAHLYRHTREQAELELRINQISRSIRTAISAGQVAESSLQELSQAMGAPLAALLFCTPEDSVASLRYVYADGGAGLRLEQGLALPVAGDAFLQRAFASAEPVEHHFDDPQPSENLPLGLLHERGVHSVLGMRLQVGKGTLGVVLAMSDAPKRWPPLAHQILTRLSGDFALALSQAEAFEKLQELSEQLRQLNEYKNNMVSISSHEMRTPLASIRAYVETMLSEPELNGAAIREFMRGMEVECIRLTNLLDDLNTLVALESRRAVWEYRVVAVGDLLERTVARVRSLAEEHRIELRVDNAIAPEALVHVDDQKVEQVLFHLLENACKHTRPGCLVELSAALEPGGDGGLVFEVCDDGPGIPDDKLEGLFQPFVRVQEVMNHSRGGAGLGLAICKEIVDQMGGRIEVQSTVGKGSLFRVMLPVQPST
jgi:signal transduction histidine kinase